MKKKHRVRTCSDDSMAGYTALTGPSGYWTGGNLTGAGLERARYAALPYADRTYSSLPDPRRSVFPSFLGLACQRKQLWLTEVGTTGGQVCSDGQLANNLGKTCSTRL